MLALLLAAIDLFLASEFLLHVAYILLATAVASLWQANILLQLLFGLATWTAIVGFHYWVFRKFVQPWLHTVFAPEKHRGVPSALAGRGGEYCVIDGRPMVRVRDELWPCVPDANLATGDLVVIERVIDGIASVVPAQREEIP